MALTIERSLLTKCKKKELDNFLPQILFRLPRFQISKNEMKVDFWDVYCQCLICLNRSTRAMKKCFKPPEACLTNINETDTLNFFIIQNATMEVLESYALKNNTKIQTRRLLSVLPELSHERTLVVDIDALPRHLWRCARWVTWRAAPRSSAGWIWALR